MVEQFKQMKPDMGIFRIRSKVNNKIFIETSQNLKAKINSTKFQLEAGAHPNKELQLEWKKFGEEQFEIEIVELLKYDKDETKTDYSEELSILKLMWEDRLNAENMLFFKKKLE